MPQYNKLLSLKWYPFITYVPLEQNKGKVKVVRNVNYVLCGRRRGGGPQVKGAVL